MYFSANPSANLVSHFGFGEFFTLELWIIGYLIVRLDMKPFAKVCEGWHRVKVGRKGSKVASAPGVLLFI